MDTVTGDGKQQKRRADTSERQGRAQRVALGRNRKGLERDLRRGSLDLYRLVEQRADVLQNPKGTGACEKGVSLLCGARLDCETMLRTFRLYRVVVPTARVPFLIALAVRWLRMTWFGMGRIELSSGVAVPAAERATAAAEQTSA